MVTETKTTKTAETPEIAEAPPKKIKQVQIELYRKDGNTYFKFHIDERLTEIFKNQAQGEMRESKSWEGLKFYYYPNITDSKEYQQLLADYQLFDDYGHSFVREGRYLNIAFLRTVGGHGEIKIKDDLPFATIATGLRSMQGFLKKFHEEFLADYKVKATLELEL